jgi:predicted P-loop ATPase
MRRANDCGPRGDSAAVMRLHPPPAPAGLAQSADDAGAGRDQSSVLRRGDVETFLRALTAQAARALAGVSSPGVLTLCRLHPTDEKLVPTRYGITGLDRMVEDSVAASKAGHDVYVEGRTVRADLRGAVRGGLADTVGVFAFVIDSDADKGMAWTATMPASLVVETSPGNAHHWLFLDRAISAAEADELGKRIRASAAADHDTGNPAQPYRVAGTTNYPNRKKQDRGRVITPTRVLSTTDRLWTPKQIIEAFPLPPEPTGSGSGSGGGGGSHDEGAIPTELMLLIRDGVQDGNRSDKFFQAVARLKLLDWSVDGIAALLEKYPRGIAAKYAGRVRAEVNRVYDKAHNRGLAAAPWRDVKDKHGNPASSLANAVIGIKALGIDCRLDLFHHAILVDYRGDLTEIKHLVGELTDDALGGIRSLINNQLGLDVGDANALAAVKEIARDHAFDPVLDYLDEVQGRWDGVKRIDAWLTDYCGAPDTPFTRAVARKHLVASVRRARQPGCKYDDILVMESPEGKNKSTAIMVLAGKENFSDQTILGVQDREAQELVTGVWLYEIADLTDIAKADVNRVKAFASRDTDRARPAYARGVEKRPRRCTFWATTNDKQYLKSQTGNRRFLPVPVVRIDLDGLRRDRDQLWAEAAVAEATGESITLDESLWTTAAEEQEQRRVIDPWEDVLADIPETIDVDEDPEAKKIIWCVAEEERVASADLLTYVLRVPVAQQTTAHGQRLATIMERIGWQRPAGGTLRIGGKPARGYTRPIEPQEPLELNFGPRATGGGRNG